MLSRNYELEAFVKDHEFSQEVDLTSLVTAKDEQSSQILELLA